MLELEKLIKKVYENRSSAEVWENEKSQAIEQLKLLGAVDGEDVTDIGRRILQLPDMNPQFSRMIVEAEKEHVLEPVLVIVSILRTGSLLKWGKYADFTKENKSDLLAELDVWNYIRGDGNVDFYKLGLNKNHFFQSLKLFKELKKALNVRPNNQRANRQTILRCCLTGLICNCYIKSSDFHLNYIDSKTNPYHLDGTIFATYYIKELFYTRDAVCNKASICYSNNSKVVIAIPQKIKTKDKGEFLNMLNFCTELNKDSVQELAPSLLEEEITKEYDANNDAVKITVKKIFAKQITISEKITIDYSRNLLYKELKIKSEETKHIFEGITDSHIIVDGKEFEVYHSLIRKPYIHMSVKDILATKQKELWSSDNSRRVCIYCDELKMEAYTIDFLKECLKNN